jgi:hypothetical protein
MLFSRWSSKMISVGSRRSRFSLVLKCENNMEGIVGCGERTRELQLDVRLVVSFVDQLVNVSW